MGRIVISQAPKAYQKYLNIGDKAPGIGNGDGIINLPGEAKKAVESLWSERNDEELGQFLEYLEKSGYIPSKLGIKCDPLKIMLDGCRTGVEKYEKRSRDLPHREGFKVLAEQLRILRRLKCGFEVKLYKLIKRLFDADIKYRGTDPLKIIKHLVHNDSINMHLLVIMMDYHKRFGVGQKNGKDFILYLQAAVDMDWVKTPLSGYKGSMKDYMECKMVSAYIRFKLNSLKHNPALLLKYLNRMYKKFSTTLASMGSWVRKNVTSWNADLGFYLYMLVEMKKLTPALIKRYASMFKYYSGGLLPKVITDSMLADEREAARKANEKYKLAVLAKIEGYGKANVHGYILRKLKLKKEDLISQMTEKLTPAKAEDLLKGFVRSLNRLEDVGWNPKLRIAKLYEDIRVNKDMIIACFEKDKTAKRKNPDTYEAQYNVLFSLLFQIHDVLLRGGIRSQLREYIKKQFIDVYGAFYYDKKTVEKVTGAVINKYTSTRVANQLKAFNPDAALAEAKRASSVFIQLSGILQVAEYYLYSGNYNKALHYYKYIQARIGAKPKEKWEKSRKRSVQHYSKLLKARIHMGKAEFDKARDILTGMQNSNEAKIELANIYFITGYHTMAQDIYEKLLRNPSRKKDVYYLAKEYSLTYLIVLHKKKKEDRRTDFVKLLQKVKALIAKVGEKKGLAFKYDLELFKLKIEYAILINQDNIDFDAINKFKEDQVKKHPLWTLNIKPGGRKMNTREQARLKPLIYSIKTLNFDIESILIVGKPLTDSKLQDRIQKAQVFLKELERFKADYIVQMPHAKIELVYLNIKIIEIASYLAVIYDKPGVNLLQIRKEKLKILTKHKIEEVFEKYFTVNGSNVEFKPGLKIYEPEKFYLLLSYVYYLQKKSTLLADPTLAQKALDIIKKIEAKYKDLYINKRNEQDLIIIKIKLLLTIALKKTSPIAKKGYFKRIFMLLSKKTPESASSWGELINLSQFKELSDNEKKLLELDLAEVGRIYVQIIKDRRLRTNITNWLIPVFQKLQRDLDGPFKGIKRKTMEDKLKVNLALLELNKVYLSNEVNADTVETVKQLMGMIKTVFKLNMNSGSSLIPGSVDDDLAPELRGMSGWNKINLYFAVADTCKMLFFLTKDLPETELKRLGITFDIKEFAQSSIKFYEAIIAEFTTTASGVDMKQREVIEAKLGILQVKMFQKIDITMKGQIKAIISGITGITPLDDHATKESNLKLRLTYLSKLAEAIFSGGSKVFAQHLKGLYGYIHKHNSKIEDRGTQIISEIRYIQVALLEGNVTNLSELSIIAKSVLDKLFQDFTITGGASPRTIPFYETLPTYQLATIFRFFDQNGIFVDPLLNSKWTNFSKYLLEVRLKQTGTKYEELYLESKIFHAEEAIWSNNLPAAESIIREIEKYTIKHDSNKHFSLRIIGSIARLARLKKASVKDVSEAYKKAFPLAVTPKNYLYKMELWCEYIEYLIYNNEFAKAKQELTRLKSISTYTDPLYKRKNTDSLRKRRILSRIDLLTFKIEVFQTYQRGSGQTPPAQTWRDASFMMLEEAKQLKLTLTELSQIKIKALRLLSQVKTREKDVGSHWVLESLIYFELGQYMLSTGEKKKGLYLIYQAYSKSPKDTEILIFLANYHHYDMNSSSKAKEFIEKILRIDPKHIGARQLLKIIAKSRIQITVEGR